MKWIRKDGNLKTILAGIVFFNLLDIVFTLVMIHLGFAVEANPFMLNLIEISELFFSAIKISLVSLCVYLLWRLREHDVARTASLICFFTYAILICYHLFGIAVSFDLAFVESM